MGGDGSTDEKRRKKRRRLGSSDTEPPRLPRERHGSFLLSFFPSRPLNYFLSFAAPHVPQTMGWLGKEKINKRGQETGRKGKDGKESGGKIDKQKKWRKAGTGGTDERASGARGGGGGGTETPSRSACTVVAFISRCQMRPHLRTASCWDARRRRTRRDTSLSLCLKNDASCN